MNNLVCYNVLCTLFDQVTPSTYLNQEFSRNLKFNMSVHITVSAACKHLRLQSVDGRVCLKPGLLITDM